MQTASEMLRAAAQTQAWALLGGSGRQIPLGRRGQARKTDTERNRKAKQSSASPSETGRNAKLQQARLPPLAKNRRPRPLSAQRPRVQRGPGWRPSARTEVNETQPRAQGAEQKPDLKRPGRTASAYKPIAPNEASDERRARRGLVAASVGAGLAGSALRPRAPAPGPRS